MMPLNIKYTLDKVTGKPVHIRNASNGLDCNCICAESECGKIMIAVQGDVNEWHFRHDIESNCKGGQETAIHKLAKQFIVENSQIQIPGETLIYTNARQEERLSSIIPDVTVVANGQNIHFEVVVTNPIDGIKEMFYKNGEHKCIEIDLRNISPFITPEELKNLVLNQIDNKRKIFWEREPVTVYKVAEDKVPWWKRRFVIARLIILGFIGSIFLYKLFKRPINKKRLIRYWQ